MANKIMIHTLQLMKLYFLDCHSKNKVFPKVTRALVTSFMKILCKTPKTGGKPSATTKQMKDEINEFYQLNYQHLQTEELKYSHPCAVLGYLADKVILMYENNITQHFVTYVERFVNVVWKKHEFIRIIKESSAGLDKKQKKIQKLNNNLRRVKNDILHPNQPFSSKSFYHTWIHQIQSMIFPNRILNKDSVFYDVVCEPQEYLIGMVFMMKQVELSGYSLMICFPLRRTVIPKHVPIDTVTLVNILVPEEIGVRSKLQRYGNLKEKQAKLCNSFFKTEKRLLHINNRHHYQFGHMIETDGLGCSILLVREDLKNMRKKPKVKIINDEKYIDELDSYEELEKKNIVAIDPNKSDLIYCVDNKNNKFRYTANQRRKETKGKKYRDIILEKKQMKIEDKSIIQWETELSSYNSQTLHMENFQSYCGVKNKMNARLSEFYLDKLFRKLKLGSFFMRQQTEDKMLNRFEKIFGSPDKTLIGFGDFEQKHKMKFHEPTKGKGFRNLLRRRGYDVYLVDEFRTSCRCNACSGECKPFKKCQNPRPWKKNEMILRRGLLVCQDCDTLWNRDNNAARNIYEICCAAIEGRDRPDYLQRSQRPVSDTTSVSIKRDPSRISPTII